MTGLLLPVPLQLPLVSIMSFTVTDNYRSGMFWLSLATEQLSFVFGSSSGLTQALHFQGVQPG